MNQPFPGFVESLSSHVISMADGKCVGDDRTSKPLQTLVQTAAFLACGKEQQETLVARVIYMRSVELLAGNIHFALFCLTVQEAT